MNGSNVNGVNGQTYEGQDGEKVYTTKAKENKNHYINSSFIRMESMFPIFANQFGRYHQNFMPCIQSNTRFLSDEMARVY